MKNDPQITLKDNKKREKILLYIYRSIHNILTCNLCAIFLYIIC